MTATIIVTLTVGIALNVTGFTLLNGFLMRSWVRAEPETVVNVFHRHSGDYNLQYSDGGISQPDFISTAIRPGRSPGWPPTIR